MLDQKIECFGKNYLFYEKNTFKQKDTLLMKYLRKGSIHRKEDISLGVFCEDFRVESIRWNDCFSQEHRQLTLNKLYDALSDLTFFIDKNSIIKDYLHFFYNNLGFYFGGKVEEQIGTHFDSKQNFIYFAYNDDGAFAHAFAHAFASWLAISHNIPKISPFFETFRSCEDSKVSKTFTRLFDYIETSNFYKHAKCLDLKLETSYWSNYSELFARSFEHWIEKKLNSNQMYNNFLVHGALYNEVANIYPCGEESKIIVNLIDNLFFNLRYVEL